MWNLENSTSVSMMWIIPNQFNTPKWKRLFNLKLTVQILQ